MLGLESVQFSIHKRREVKLQHFLSRTLFGTLYVRGRERTVFLYIRVGKLSYSIFPLVLYSAPCMLGIESVQFSLHQVKKVKLQHFLFRTQFGTLYVRVRERTVFLTSG